MVKILAYAMLLSPVLAIISYISYMVVCTKVELKKLEKK